MPLKLFTRLKKHQPEKTDIIIVSGLPRSGTSMMMQILRAGGLEILTDNERIADSDNPKGYYELERVKQLKDGDNHWVKDAHGKAIKVISALLEHLPKEYHYKVIFMMRDMDEILASQKQMLIRRGEPTDKVSDESLADLFQEHLTSVRNWLANQANMEVIYVNYNDLLQDLEQHINSIIDFLDLPLDIKSMLDVPDRSLYRQRA